MSSPRCPRCQSDDVRPNRFRLADGTLYELLCQTCGLWEQRRSEEADFDAWSARWSMTGAASEAEDGAPAPAAAPAPVAPDLLLAAVTRAPADDRPRLAYADAVAAVRPERAELIRLQVARAQHERARGALVAAPSEREVELVRARGASWAQHVDPFVRPTTQPVPDPGWRFERGFIGFVRVTPDTLASMGERLFELAPIRHLDLAAETPVRPALASPLFARLTSLGLASCGLDDDDAVALAASPHLAGLRYLDLRDNRIGERGVAALAASPAIRAIPIVLLGGNPCDPATQYSLDWDGSVADSWMPDAGAALERAHGRIAWLHLLPYARQPDRYHV